MRVCSRDQGAAQCEWARVTVEQADLAGGEVCAVGSRQARPYGMAL